MPRITMNPLMLSSSLANQGIDEVASHMRSQGTTRAYESSVCAAMNAASGSSVKRNPGPDNHFTTSPCSYFYLCHLDMRQLELYLFVLNTYFDYFGEWTAVWSQTYTLFIFFLCLYNCISLLFKVRSWILAFVVANTLSDLPINIRLIKVIIHKCYTI